MRTLHILSLPCLLIGAAFSSPSLADKLPKSAVTLSPAEVTSLYSDHTAVWAPTAMAYFAADGSVKEVVADTSKPGKWTVSGNEICIAIQGVDAGSKKLDGKTYTDCWQWFKSGRTYYALYSKHWDNSKVDKKNVNAKEIETLKAGDLVGAKYVPPAD